MHRPTDPGKNWAGNHKYRAAELYQPESIAEIQELVRKFDKVKALGSRHCFNDIADSPIALISTDGIEQKVEIDESAMSVTIPAGMRYGQICPSLDERGFALHNLASLPHISVTGACATATHGSGVTNRNLGSAVSAIEFVSASGELVTLTRHADSELLNGSIVNLGGLGIITKVTLDIERSFSVRQNVFQDLSFDVLCENFDEIVSAGYSVSLFTYWKDRKIDQVWVKRRDDEHTSDFFGAKATTEDLHPLTGISAEHCTDQMGVPGKWYERLPHFKMEFTPSDGEELQSEYFVSRESAVEAILAIDGLRDVIAPQLLVSEIRTIAADSQWLSPCREIDSVALHFTWKQNIAEVNRILPMIEAALAPFDARPHWGKLFTTPKQKLRSLYPKMSDFIELLETHDPHGKFRNEFLDRNIFD